MVVCGVCCRKKEQTGAKFFKSLFTILMDLLCLRVPQRPRCPDLRSNDTAHKRFIQLEALTLDPQDEKIRREVFRLTTEAARGSPRGFCQPYWKTKPPESVYHVKRACTILSATVLMNIKVLAFIVCQLLLTIKVNKPMG